MGLGYWLIFLGIGLALVGLLILLGLPLGKLPGDIHLKGEKTSVYFPVVTFLIISIVLSIILNLFFWFRK